MANTYSQIYIQIVFTVKYRQNLIAKEHRVSIEKFITGIVTNRKQKLLAIYAMPDHIHILVNIKPNISISDLVRDIKAGSSKFINDNNLVNGKFRWQNGFGAFSYSYKAIGNVIRYIQNQEVHHKTKTFKQEYMHFLNVFDVDYDDKYLFEFYNKTDDIDRS